MKPYRSSYYRRHVVNSLEKMYLKLVYSLQYRDIQEIIKNNNLTILDIGCGDGDFLANAPSQFVSKTGIDFNISNPSEKVKFVQGDVFKYKFNQKFDVITAHHILEHVDTPSKFIKKIISLVKSNGVVCISTPNIESIGYKIGKDKWFHFDRPFHRQLFGTQTLRTLLRNEGLEVKIIKGEFPGFPFDVYHTLKNMGSMWLLTLPILIILKIFIPETIVAICIKK